MTNVYKCAIFLPNLEVILDQSKLVIRTKKHNNINMSEAESMEKHVERKLLIAQLAQQVFSKHPGSRSETIWRLDIIAFSPLLENTETFLIAVERVVEELTPGFEIITTEYYGWRSEDILGITIDEPKRLDRYIAEKEMELAEIRKETNRHKFTLDEDANLYLANSDLPPYSIERGSLRHKLIYYLAKHGGYMSAAQLAEKVDSNPKRVRTTIGQLRGQVTDRFNVPGMDLVQSRDTGSYRAGTITLRVPKGYTP